MDETDIRKYAIQNAVRFGGKANPKAVIGKVIAAVPDARDKLAVLSKQIAGIVKEVNSLSADRQKEELEKYTFQAPDKPETHLFSFLGIREGQKIVTAFPPEPSKYPHIGHAKACLLNYELAKKYNGRFILRFEDTNPNLVREEYYTIHLDSYMWLGIRPDEVDYASDHMADFYRLAEKLIHANKAYVCSCSQERIKESRLGKPCQCRLRTAEANVLLWKVMFSSDEGKFVLRLKIDLEHKNSTMRDPTIMRIIKVHHPRLKGKFTVWPNYDFENAVMDALEGITHRLRSKEFEMRNELQRWIQGSLGFPETSIYEFARFNMEGVLSSGRVIREKIENKELIGWDDPSLTTLAALRRRGFLPRAIHDFVLKTGITKVEATLSWDDFVVHNRRLLDSTSNRYFFVDSPVKVRIRNAPEQKVSLKIHPKAKSRSRHFKTHELFYISEEDSHLKPDRLYRLMDCLNFRNCRGQTLFDSLDVQNFRSGGDKIMHWLPVDKTLVKVQILMPDHTIRKGLAESLVSKLKPGITVQFERFGFCKLDKINREYFFWFTHN
ncbi:MAG: glutamate--tRNA ligase [archaeon]